MTPVWPNEGHGEEIQHFFYYLTGLAEPGDMISEVMNDLAPNPWRPLHGWHGKNMAPKARWIRLYAAPNLVSHAEGLV
jgi:hypothetical protein